MKFSLPSPGAWSSVWALGTSTDSYHHTFIQHTLNSSSSELGSGTQNARVSKIDMIPDLWNLLFGVDMDPAQGIGTKTARVLGWGRAQSCGDMVSLRVGVSRRTS